MYQVLLLALELGIVVGVVDSSLKSSFLISVSVWFSCGRIFAFFLTCFFHGLVFAFKRVNHITVFFTKKDGLKCVA